MRWRSSLVRAAVLVVLLPGPAVLFADGARAAGGIPEKKSPSRDASGTGTARAADHGYRATAAVSLGEEVRELRIAQVVPRGALLYVSFPDLARLAGAAEELAVVKMLREPIISARLERAIDHFRSAAREASPRGLAGFLKAAVAADVDYRAAASAFRKDLAIVGLPPAREDEGMRLAVVAVVGDGSRRALTEEIDILMGALSRDYSETTPERRGGAEIRGLKLGSFRVSFAFFENLFIVGTELGTVAELINTYSAGRKAQLAEDKEFKAALEDLGKGAAIFYRVDLVGVGEAMTALAPEAAGMGPARAALAGSGTLWGAVYADGEAVRERMKIRAPVGGRLPGVTAGAPLPMPPRSMKYFSVDTALYAVMQADLAKAYEEAKKTPSAALGMTMLAAGAGVDFERDIEPVLPAFGGEIALGVVLPHGRPPEILLCLQIKRRDLMDRFDRTVARAAGARLKADRYRDHVVRYVEAPGEPAQASIWSIAAPELAYARSRQEGQDFLLIASTRRALEKAIRQQHFEKSSLFEKADFRRCTRTLRPRWTSALYVNAWRALDALRSPMTTESAGQIPGVLARSDVAGAISPHLFGFGAVAAQSETVGFYESYGPLGPMTGAGVGMLAGLAGRAQQQTPRAAGGDADDLARIGLGIQLYATDFDRFPAGLSELYDEYVPSLAVFNSPAGRSEVKAKADIDTRSDYVYVEGLSPTDLSSMIVAYTREGVGSDQLATVVYLDGRVAVLPRGEFQATLAGQLESLTRR